MKIEDMNESELKSLGEQISERRAALAVERGRINEQEFSIDKIRPGMSADETRAAARAIVKALEDQRR